MSDHPFSRRDFLRLSALSVGGLTLRGPSFPQVPGAPRVGIVIDFDDRVVGTEPVLRAIVELRKAFAAHGVTATIVESVEDAGGATLCVVVAPAYDPIAASILKTARVPAPAKPESLALATSAHEGVPILLACAPDARGLMYAVLEVTERVQYGEDPIGALRATAPTSEQPFNAVRAIGRPLVSDVEDKAWFYDRGFWPAYFGMLARQRVNRFHLALGFGYDTLRWVVDAYLLFPYPFLLSVPAFGVRAAGLPDEERDRNLETLRFISQEAAAHAIDFQVGLWTHGCRWEESPNANYTIEGITPENHAAYCREALAMLLQQCPDITGVTLRTHYESGVHEGSYAFWKTIFDGVPRSGRRVEIELHAKGLDQKMIDGALSLGVPVRVSAKYWAEHLGLPYHQAAIRELELPHVDPSLDPFSALSMGSRNHTRYGYADFLAENRPYGVMYRVFPGTHKFLPWGDPVTAAAHARRFQFCGSDGAEWLEPLAFKGRRGSGREGGRLAYVDAARNGRDDWRKYLYTYVLWGRLLYNPDADADTWRRVLRAQYGRSVAPEMEGALGCATRILPLITTAHLPSAAQDTYSPEFYTNQSIVDPKAPSPYGDTPAPKVFGSVSPLDPQLFSTIDAFATELLAGDQSGKYSPVEVAARVESLADAAAAALFKASVSSMCSAEQAREGSRAAIDIRVQIGIGRFFAAKLRSGVLYRIYRESGDRLALEEALGQYRKARNTWAEFAEEAKRVYVTDITFGPLPHQRGHWSDRLAAIDRDIAAMEKELEGATPGARRSQRVANAIAACLGRPARRAASCRHHPPASFVPGAPLVVSLGVAEPAAPSLVRIHYRHVNQADRYQVADMTRHDGAYHVTIPASYTDTRYPLQYYFELKQGREQAWLYPGFNADLTNEPYFVVRRRGPARSSE